MQPRVQVDIGQILALLGGEEFSGATHAGHSIQLVVRASRRGGTDECTLSCHIDPIRAQRAQGAFERGKSPARKLKRAQILLAADAGVSDEDIALSVGVGGSSVYRTKRRFVECFDESPIQLIGEVRQPIPATPGQIERYDCEYRRNGTANLFVFQDVNRPWRKVKVTERRAAEDFAACMRDLADVHYPGADWIRVVLDNRSTHSAGALYQTFPADEARRILRRLEFHYVPKHASWLDDVQNFSHK